MNICLIPARGGSQRIPRKNIREFCGLPMITRAIQTAISAGLFQRIVVSTDDDEIAAIAIAGGAEVPFRRPIELAENKVTTIQVVAHAIAEMDNSKIPLDRVCCLYPCTPLLTATDLVAGLECLIRSGSHFSFPIAEHPSPIQRALERLDSGNVNPIFPVNESMPSQNFPVGWYDAGQFYWGHWQSWLNEASVHSNAAGHPIPRWRAIDIDNEKDWEFAELVFMALKQRENNGG